MLKKGAGNAFRDLPGMLFVQKIVSYLNRA